jgi:DNA-binding IscR family transcriptional regulator
MRTASRFAIAVHVLSLLGVGECGEPTSEGMAESIGVNPVVVRNITGMLRRAGLVRTRQGVPGTHLARPLAEITLLDVYRAVEDAGDLFAVHPRPNPRCPVGGNIGTTLDKVFGEAQRAMESRLADTTMAEVVRDLRSCARPGKG